MDTSQKPSMSPENESQKGIQASLLGISSYASNLRPLNKNQEIKCPTFVPLPTNFNPAKEMVFYRMSSA